MRDQLHIKDRAGVIDRLRRLVERKEREDPPSFTQSSYNKEALKALDRWIDEENERLDKKQEEGG